MIQPCIAYINMFKVARISSSAIGEIFADCHTEQLCRSGEMKKLPSSGRFFLFSLEDLSRLKYATTNVDAWKIIRSMKPYIHGSIVTSHRPSVTENQWMRHSSEQWKQCLSYASIGARLSAWSGSPPWRVNWGAQPTAWIQVVVMKLKRWADYSFYGKRPA
jgi:hypothetical protein